MSETHTFVRDDTITDLFEDLCQARGPSHFQVFLCSCQASCSNRSSCLQGRELGHEDICKEKVKSSSGNEESDISFSFPLDSCYFLFLFSFRIVRRTSGQVAASLPYRKTRNARVYIEVDATLCDSCECALHDESDQPPSSSFSSLFLVSTHCFSLL